MIKSNDPCENPRPKKLIPLSRFWKMLYFYFLLLNIDSNLEVSESNFSLYQQQIYEGQSYRLTERNLD